MVHSSMAAGLLVMACLGLLMVALRRWYDPLPLKVGGAFLFVIVLLFGRALFLGDVVLPLNALWDTAPFTDLERVSPTALGLQWDLVQDLVPYQAQSRRLLARGEWPLNTDLMGAGEPFLANSQAQHFHPLILLTLILPLAQAVGAISALKVLLCLVFTYLLLRRCGVGMGGALGGSLAYGLSGFVMLYLGWPQAQSAAALPLLLYALEVTFGRGRRRDYVLLGIATATLILGGHPETIVYVAAAGTCFALERWLVTTRGAPWSRRMRPLGRSVLAAGLGFLVTAPSTLTVLQAIPESERGVAVERRNDGRQQGSTIPGDWERELEETELRAVPVLAPLAFGSERYGKSWGYGSILHAGSAFAGTSTLVLALLGLGFCVRPQRSFPGERSMAAITALSALIFIQPPGLLKLMSFVPVLDQSGSENRRLSMIVCFGLAFLAACTWERARRGRVRAWIAAMVAAALIAFLAWAYAAHPNPQRPNAQEHPRQWALHLQMAVAATMGLMLLGGAPTRYGFVLLVGFELFQLHGGLSPAMPRSHFFPDRPSISFLQDNLRTHRMVGMGGWFRHNLPAMYEIADVRSGSPMQPARLSRATVCLRPDLWNRDFVVPDHPLYDLLGVRYVVTGPKEELEAPLRKVFSGAIGVWERPRPLPRLFFPRSATVERTPDWDRHLWEIQDFRREALVERLSDSGSAWSSKLRDPRLRRLTLSPAQISAKVTLRENRLLASGVYQDGGWSVLVDGKKTESVRTNGAFVGAWLPEGKHHLELVYRPPGFLLGCLLGGIAAAFALALSLSMPRKRAGGRSI